jgi:hypothetical protein
MPDIFPSNPATGRKSTPIILNILEIKTLTPSIIPPTLKTLQILTADPTTLSPHSTHPKASIPSYTDAQAGKPFSDRARKATSSVG